MNDRTDSPADAQAGPLTDAQIDALAQSKCDNFGFLYPHEIRSFARAVLAAAAQQEPRWDQAQAVGAAVEAADRDSRGMFVARLENMQKNGDTWLTVQAVLALLNDCDMLAQPLHQEPAAWRDVLAERRRQVEVEGWTPEHDDQHNEGGLAVAAACYVRHTYKGFVGVPGEWCWDASWWKPKDSRSNLVKAGALILAEIERLDRAIDRASAAPRKATRAPCSLGVGCDESGVCYAAAHGQPDQCGATDSEGGTPD